MLREGIKNRGSLGRGFFLWVMIRGATHPVWDRWANKFAPTQAIWLKTCDCLGGCFADDQDSGALEPKGGRVLPALTRFLIKPEKLRQQA